jgi:hypothetical protein
MRLVAAALFLVISSIGAAQQPVPAYIPPPPEQPLPYSHRQHLAVGVTCATCHSMPPPGHAATLPATATCMSCHARVKTDSPAIQELAKAHAAGKPIPWKRVYKVPDFVSFSHKVHVTGAAALDCDVCHGPVREMDVMQRVKDISMPACVECHQQKQAPVRCDTCHDPR